jgi:hypothetical protein
MIFHYCLFFIENKSRKKGGEGDEWSVEMIVYCRQEVSDENKGGRTPKGRESLNIVHETYMERNAWVMVCTKKKKMF